MGDSFAMNFVPMTPKKLRFNLKDDPDKDARVVHIHSYRW